MATETLQQSSLLHNGQVGTEIGVNTWSKPSHAGETILPVTSCRSRPNSHPGRHARRSGLHIRSSRSLRAEYLIGVVTS